MDRRPKLMIACTHSLGAKFLKGQLLFMNESGFDVFVVCAPGKEIEELCAEENATFLPFLFKREINFFYDLICVVKLVFLIRKVKPDIVNTGTPKAGLLVSFSCFLMNFHPVIFTLRGLRSETLVGIKKKVVRMMEKLTCSLADYIIPISPSLKDYAIEQNIMIDAKSFVFGKGSSNGIDIDFFRKRLTQEERIVERASIGFGLDDVVLAYVGRINNDKGIPELFNCFKDLYNQDKRNKLLIVGQFEKEDALDEALRNDLLRHPGVIILPYQDNVRYIYELIDVLILFSKREGFGNILVEAASMEVPVIARKIPGCRDAVKDNYNGFLVKSSDELYEAISNYSQNRELRFTHGRNGRLWVMDNFQSMSIWNKQLLFYKDLLRNSNFYSN